MTGEPIGFLGLGIMGRPMAGNLARAGTPLVVWSRTPEHCDDVCASGAHRAATPDEVFARCRVVILMLATDQVVDEVLGRGTADFRRRVAGHVLVHMGTTAPEYAGALGADITAADGCYVEAPVSGSRVPAENGELVAMIAGPPETLDEVEPILQPMCRGVVRCGSVAGSALTMKLAVNLYLVTTVAALAEAAHFAQRQGLDVATFESIVNSGQLASPIAEVKGAKLRNRDFTVQAAIHDVRKNSRLVAEAARAAGIAAPLVELADQLYLETLEHGHGQDDMAAVIHALEARSDALSRDRSAPAVPARPR
jgi:3-hydroxyisobutyrate dehydrogenase